MAHTSNQTFSLSLNSISNLFFSFSLPFRKFFNESYYYLDEASPAAAASAAAATMAPEWELESVGPDGKPTAIPAHLYIQRVAAMHADGDVGFAKEFESVHNMANGSDSGSDESGSLTSSTGSSTVSSGAAAAEASRRAKNRAKNRYPNVVACKKGLNNLNIRMWIIFFPFLVDHTRVQLRPLPGQKKGEYVNANYIDGFQKARAYIGTQGPLPNTFDSFWRMVWEQKVRVVVMITDLVEMGKVRRSRSLE